MTDGASYEYIYLGDRQTRSGYRKMLCLAVRNAAGKCIRGRNGSFLVEFADGSRAVVIGRLLRKYPKVRTSGKDKEENA